MSFLFVITVVFLTKSSDICNNDAYLLYQEIMECSALTIDNINSDINIKCTIDNNIYELISQIGSGYFAVVYLAIKNKHEKVAIKFQFDLNNQHTMREIEALLDIDNKLTNNNNNINYKYAKLIDYSPKTNDSSTNNINCIVAVFTYYKNGDMPHFLSSYQLKKKKKEKELFAIRSTIKYLDEISFLLQTLNQDLKLTHCDVKDENILINYDNKTDVIDFYLCDFALIHSINEIQPCGAPMFWPKEMYNYYINDFDEKYMKNKQDLLDIVGLNAVAIMWYAKLCDNNTLITIDSNNELEYIISQNELCITCDYLVKYYEDAMSDGLQLYKDVEAMINVRQYNILAAVSKMKHQHGNTIEAHLAQLFANHINTFKKKKWHTFRQQLKLIMRNHVFENKNQSD